jgi:3-hydroxyacyl-[acyl-carrier-protein] dehydratase
VPGVILVETMAQAGGVGVKLQGISAAGTFFLAAINNVKFRRQVRPGDLFEMKIHNLRASARLIKQKGVGYVNGEEAVEADWLCIVGEEMV